MIVVVETNFILELALQQTEAEPAERILQLAEGRRLELAVPAYAIAEAYGRLAAQSKKRNSLLNDLRAEIKQMARSRPFAELGETSKAVTDALASSGTQHIQDLERTLARLKACAAVIALTQGVLEVAPFLDLLYGFDLEPGDALIYASVESYFKEGGGGRKVFITKDEDFEQTRRTLEASGVTLVRGFGAAFGTITKEL